jgi:hypothetical protein
MSSRSAFYKTIHAIAQRIAHAITSVNTLDRVEINNLLKRLVSMIRELEDMLGETKFSFMTTATEDPAIELYKIAIESMPVNYEAVESFRNFVWSELRDNLTRARDMVKAYLIGLRVLISGADMSAIDALFDAAESAKASKVADSVVSNDNCAIGEKPVISLSPGMLFMYSIARLVRDLGENPTPAEFITAIMPSIDPESNSDDLRATMRDCPELIQQLLLDMAEHLYGGRWDNQYSSLEELFREIMESFRDPIGYDEWATEQLLEKERECALVEANDAAVASALEGALSPEEISRRAQQEADDEKFARELESQLNADSA